MAARVNYIPADTGEEDCRFAEVFLVD